MKLVYISSPYNSESPDDIERNTFDALRACEETYNLNRFAEDDIIPITPHVNFPYLDGQNANEKTDGTKIKLLLLSKCDEMWVAGDRITENMRDEIHAAVRMEIPVLSMGMESKKIQDVADAMHPMLGEWNCYENSNKQDYTDQLLILKPSALAPWAREDINQIWRAENGFGLSPDASGRAVYATCLYDGEEARWNRGDFIGIADPNRLPEWAADKLSEIQHEDEEDEQQ